MPEMLFEISGVAMKPGQIYEGVRTTVEKVKENKDLSAKVAGQCALALQLALEADNVDAGEKAYARTKIYDSLAKLLEQITEQMNGVPEGGELTKIIALILDPTAADDDAEGDAL